MGDADVDLAELDGFVAGLDILLEPYRRKWQLIVELSELLADTGKIRLEWTD